jgi:hypothetical protein
MKKIALLPLAALAVFTACSDDPTSLAAPGAPLFDNLQTQSDLIVSGTATITAGNSAQIAYRLGATGPDGCNVDAENPAAVTINVPAGVTADPANFQFTKCGASGDRTVTFSSNTAGNYPITASISGGKPDNNGYNTNPSNFTLVVEAAAPSMQDQTITFPKPDDVLFSVDGTVALNATASSGLQVSYESLTPTVCGISGSNATMLKAGTCTIRASQEGNAEYTAAPAVDQSFEILAWTFEGFFSPVRGDVINRARSGSTVPLGFRLWAGETEITSTTSVSFRAVLISCDEAGDVLNAEDVFATSGKTELRYEDEKFKQNWQTPRNPGACYRATATALDGSTLNANFMLNR